MLKRDSLNKSAEPRRASGIMQESRPLPGSQDPIKFLQQYFKQPDTHSGKKGRKVHHANYFMDKLDR